MRIMIEDDGRKYEAVVNNIEEFYNAVHDGLVAMSYHKDTAKNLVEELKEDIENEK